MSDCHIFLIRRLKQVILPALIALSAITQAQSFYNEVYKADRPAMRFSSIINEDSCYYIVGATTSYSPPFITRSMIAKIDTGGQLLKYQAIYDLIKRNGVFMNCLIKNEHGDYIFTGYIVDSLPRVMFGKYNSLLDTIQILEYQTPFSYAFNGEGIIEYDTNVFYIAGVRTDSSSLRSNVMLMKIDSAGNRLWEKYYGGFSVAESTTSFIKLNNDNLMIGCYRRDFGDVHERSYTWFLEVDTGGTIVRQWLDPNDSTYGAYGLLQTKDGGFIYSAQRKIIQYPGVVVLFEASIVKMDSSFNKQWTYRGGGGTQYTGIFDLQELEDGGFIGCGNKPIYKGDSTMISGWIIKIDSIGQVIWDKEYTGLDEDGVWNFLYDVDVLSDGGIIACGESQIPNQGQHGWIVRLDSNGCEVENCLVGVDEVWQPEREEVKFYPNPATNKIYVSHDLSERIKEVSVFDMEGRIVTSPNTTLQNLPIEIDTQHLPDGIYFMQVKSEGERSWVKKFIILKE